MPHYRDDRTQMLMQLLPVILAQQQHEAQLAQQGQWHQGELGNQQAQLAELAKYHQGELDHQKALEALGIRQADSQDRHQQALIDAQHEENQNRMNMEVVSHLMNNPNISLDKALPLLGTIAPQLKPLASTWHEGVVNSAIQNQMPAVSGMYDLYNKSHDYAQLQKGLDTIRPTMAPEVFAGLPWDQLNQGMAAAPSSTSAFAPGSVDANVIAQQQAGQNQGGLFGRGGMFDMRNQLPPENQAQQNQFLQNTNQLPGPLSFLFGASSEQVANKKRLEDANNSQYSYLPGYWASLFGAKPVLK